jgi:hypothetical protein
VTPEEIQQWTLWIRIAGVLVSFLGLGGVVLSLIQVSKTIAGNALANAFFELREIHKILISFPDLRPYFFEGRILSREDSDYQKARGVAEMFLDAFIHMYTLRPRLDKKSRLALDRYIEHMCFGSSVLSDYLEENLFLVYPDKLKEFLQAITQKRKAHPS